MSKSVDELFAEGVAVLERLYGGGAAAMGFSATQGGASTHEVGPCLETSPESSAPWPRQRPLLRLVDASPSQRIEPKQQD